MRVFILNLAFCVSALLVGTGVATSAESFSKSEPVSATKRWLLHANVQHRLGGESIVPYNLHFLVSMECDWLRNGLNKRGWGLGVRGAWSDDGGPLFGPQVFWWQPVRGQSQFAKAATGVYVFGFQLDTAPPTMIDLPGYFAQIEYGFVSGIYAVVGAEYLPLEIKSSPIVARSSNTNIWGGIGLGSSLREGGFMKYRVVRYPIIAGGIYLLLMAADYR